MRSDGDTKQTNMTTTEQITENRPTTSGPSGSLLSRWKRRGWVFTLLAATGFLLAQRAYAGPPIHVVHGHGVVHRTAGAAEGGNDIWQISVNAQQNADGSVHGFVVWPWEVTPVPPDGGHPDPLTTAYTWVVAVDFMFVDGNWAYLEGVVVHSEVLTDVGTRTSFFVEDNENNPSDPADRIDGISIVAGNYIVQ